MLLENPLVPSAVNFASYVFHPLSIGTGDSLSYVGDFNSSADLIISDVIPEINSEHYHLHLPLSDLKLPYKAPR